MAAGVNLLSWRIEACLNKERAFKKHLFVVFVVVIFVLSFWHIALWRQINIERKQNGPLRQQLILLEQQLKDENKLKEQQQKQQQATSKIIKLEGQQLKLAQVFENLHRGMAANTQLTQVVIKKDSVKLSGKAETMFGVTHLIKTFAQAKNCSVPLVQKISQQDDEYDFVLSLSCGGR
jgi:Tfp pilus assembly protein PilN